MSGVIRLPAMSEGIGPDRTARRIRAVASGSHPDFEALYRETAPAVDRYLTGVGVHHQLAADVLQDTYLAVWRDAARYRGEASALSWILGIARHKLADYRRADRETPVEAVTGEEAATENAGYDTARVGELLSGLSSADRELLHLVFVADLGYGEVARMLNIPVGTVKSRVFRLRKTIREREGTYAE